MAISTLQVNEFGDLYLVDGANLAIITGEVAVAQDVDQATKMVLGEDPFDTSKGVDYFGTVFAPSPDYDAFRSQLTTAALSVRDTLGVTSLTMTKDGNEITYAMDVSTIYGAIDVAQTIEV
ncbi:putative tail lysozyme [Aeromonas phage Gekk3-15]